MLLGHPGSTSLLLIQLAPAVLSLLEVSLEIICCCGSEACCSILLSFFCRCKMMISESGLGPWEVREVAWEWDLVDKVVGGSLPFGSSPKTAALQGQFDRHCHGAGHNSWTIRWIFFPPPNGILQTLREFQYKKWDLLCAALCALWLHIVVSWHYSPATEIIFLWFLMICKPHIPVVHSRFFKSFFSVNLTEGIMSFCCCVL